MYIPDKALNLKDAKRTQIRLGLQGAPVSGKTFALCTAPNLCVIDYDNKMGQHIGKDITIIPFYDDAFVDSIATRKDKQSPSNRKDALLNWLRIHAQKLEADQTLAIDSMSMVEIGFDQEQDLHPVYTKSGGIDDFAFWALKQDYYRDLLTTLKSLKCNVICTFHEVAERDSKGSINGKLKPLMTGKFQDKLQAHFTDWYRQVATNKDPNDASKSLPYTQYFWQTAPDSVVNCGSSIPKLPKFVPATWDIFIHPELYQVK